MKTCRCTSALDVAKCCRVGESAGMRGVLLLAMHKKEKSRKKAALNVNHVISLLQVNR